MLPGCFSNFSLDQISLPNELLIHFSQLKLDGEDRTSISKHIYDFLQIFHPFEIDNEESPCVLFFLALEGCANQWCPTLPHTFVHSLLPFLKELHQAFNKYNNRDVFGESTY